MSQELFSYSPQKRYHDKSRQKGGDIINHVPISYCMYINILFNKKHMIVKNPSIITQMIDIIKTIIEETTVKIKGDADTKSRTTQRFMARFLSRVNTKNHQRRALIQREEERHFPLKNPIPQNHVYNRPTVSVSYRYRSHR